MYVKKCLIISVVFGLCVGHLNGDDPCSASENKKWNLKKRKCVDCKRCPQGTARNFSEPYVGPSVSHGNTRCLPCRECPKGFYAGENDCLPCRVDCVADYKRVFDVYCEKSHDARCGSCLFGYEDKLRDTQLPCYPKVKPTTISTTEKAAISNVEIAKNDSQNEEDVDFKVDSSDTNADNASGEDMVLIYVSLGVGVSVIVILLVASVAIKYRKKLCKNTQESFIGDGSDGVDNDLQIDGGSAFSSRSEVRGELPASAPLVPRPELSNEPNFGNTKPFGNVEYQPIPQTPESQTLECGCQKLPDCQCFVTNIPDIEIKKSDENICIVSRKICHTERLLYEELKLDAPEIFSQEDDRRMDPKGITLGDKVLSLLNRWVEKRPTPVTLHTLMKALCKSHFHNINGVLVQKFSDASSLENDNGGNS